MNQDKQILIDLQAQVVKLTVELSNVSAMVNKNNFSSFQTFNKDVEFQGRMRVPVFSAAPSVGSVGDLICVSAKLYVCTTAGSVASPAVFTLVGSQT